MDPGVYCFHPNTRFAVTVPQTKSAKMVRSFASNFLEFQTVNRLNGKNESGSMVAEKTQNSHTTAYLRRRQNSSGAFEVQLIEKEMVLK